MKLRDLTDPCAYQTVLSKLCKHEERKTLEGIIKEDIKREEESQKNWKSRIMAEKMAGAIPIMASMML